MSSTTDIVVLAVCEDGKWGLAGRYQPGRAQRAISDAKLMMRAGGVAAARVLRHVLDPRTRAARRELLFDDVRPGAEPPPAPAFATPSGERAAAPSVPVALHKQAPAIRPAIRRGFAAFPMPIGRGPSRLEPAAAARRGGIEEAPPGRSSFGAFLMSLGALFSFGPPSASDSSEAPPRSMAARLPNEPGATADERGIDRPAPRVAAAQDTRRLLAFVELCLLAAAKTGGVPDGRIGARARFALHLLMLGAGEACLGAESCGDSQALAGCIADALALLGSGGETAARLAASRQSYAQDPKPAAMLSAGMEAMATFPDARDEAERLVVEAFRQWNMIERTGSPTEGPDVAIMFTDMVSSVQTTQALGEEGMMRLLSQHDLIVGAVLKRWRGHQVKHTGDGIMAVFPRVLDGIAAAADIQRDIELSNAAMDGMALKVRIGLSAGNPIRKDDDYFGTVVQTAARVCPLAGAGEVALPEAMAASAGCAGFSYSDPILAELKGFAEPQPVRKLLWRVAAA